MRWRFVLYTFTANILVYPWRLVYVIEESLSSILQKSNPYPCLALLESGLISYKESEHKTIPQELLKDFACIYGKELADDAIKCLVNLEAIEENEIGLLINDEASNIISSWLNQLKEIYC